MIPKKKRQRHKGGDVFVVPLTDGAYSLRQILGCQRQALNSVAWPFTVFESSMGDGDQARGKRWDKFNLSLNGVAQKVGHTGIPRTYRGPRMFWLMLEKRGRDLRRRPRLGHRRGGRCGCRRHDVRVARRCTVRRSAALRRYAADRGPASHERFPDVAHAESLRRGRPALGGKCVSFVNFEASATTNYRAGEP